MYLKSIELSGFKSFGKKSELVFTSLIAGVVGPNGSGKSNIAEAFRFVLGEQSMKSLRSKKGEDLIWGGSPSLPRANRASAKVVFDNSTHLLDVDFSEVVIERVVYRDGQNEYLLNGTQVRLKDVIRLLAGANIGGSGYQIISQGEADRILNASHKERREMVEDALGLKLYQHKKAESERKLEETATNIDKTKSLRRELLPHLNFLRNQVEKIEKARDMKENLAACLNEYLAREHAWITQEDARLLEELRTYEAQAKEASARIEESRAKRSQGFDTSIQNIQTKVHDAERALQEVRHESERVSRELGRAEGALDARIVPSEVHVSASHARQFASDMEHALAEALQAENIILMRLILVRMKEQLYSFVKVVTGVMKSTDNNDQQQNVVRLSEILAEVQKKEIFCATELERLRVDLFNVRESGLVAERDSIAMEGIFREVQNKLNVVQSARASVIVAREHFEEEVREGITLIGTMMSGWNKASIPDGALSEDRGVQEKRRRDIERLKIKIEESGVGNGDAIIREFKDTKQRDEFLGSELADLETSAVSLHTMITDLEHTIDARFTEGLVRINVALTGFFSKLFGGGEARLIVENKDRSTKSNLEDDEEHVVEEEENLYAGLSISVSLPRKKIRGLDALSGGERALTSIALIFSMSQVNPPPFLILDETDAALDEANSRRYADMIRELGEKSQLIVITHNRATMAAAGELYGVTMDASGVSKLLSVKIEEATRIAK